MFKRASIHLLNSVIRLMRATFGFLAVPLALLSACLFFAVPSLASETFSEVSSDLASESVLEDSAQPLLFSIVINEPMLHRNGQFVVQVFTEVFKRLETPFIYQTFPASRATRLLMDGTLDGHISRVYEYQTLSDVFVRVEEPHLHSGIVAVTSNSEPQFEGWTNLSKREGLIGIQRGLWLPNKELRKVVDEDRIIEVTNTRQGLFLLQAERINYLVAPDLDVLSVLQEEDFENSKFFIAGVMQWVSTHMYLHKRHEALAPKISEAIQVMKKEGMFEKFWLRTRPNVAFDPEYRREAYLPERALPTKAFFPKF